MDAYNLLQKIGEGAHGQIYKAEVKDESRIKRWVRRSEEWSRDTQEEDDEEEVEAQEPQAKKAKMESSSSFEVPREVAIKTIEVRSSKEGFPQDCIREIRYLPHLRHDYILPILDIFNHREECDEQVNLVLELMNTDLEKLIKDTNVAISAADVKQYMHMLLLAIEHCHSHWVLHRDIKPSNLLVSSDGSLKLSDFGLARVFGDMDVSLSPQACTLWYRAPELLYGAKQYGTGMDMWSVGCVFAELLLRKPIFPGTSELDQLASIFRVLGTPTESDWPHLTSLPSFIEFNGGDGIELQHLFPAASPEALDLFSSMMAFDPSSRLTATQALAHPYFTTGPEATPIRLLPQR